CRDSGRTTATDVLRASYPDLMSPQAAMARFWSAKVDSYSSAGVGFGLSGRSFMARFSGLEIEPCIVLEGRILSNAFASRDFFWSDHGPADDAPAGFAATH